MIQQLEVVPEHQAVLDSHDQADVPILGHNDAESFTEERALILNALFRPTPPYSGDDGPPSGLIDLIKSRHS